MRNPFKNIFGVNEKRSASNPPSNFLTHFLGWSTSAGINISHETALTLSAVWRAVSVVSGTMAFLPLQVYRKQADNSREYLQKHFVQRLLNDPSENMSGFFFRQTMQAFKMLWGNAYAVIRYDKNTYPVELIPLHPDNVNPELINGRLIYRVRSGHDVINLLPYEILHLPGLGFDGVKGKSVIQIQRESLGLTKAAETFGSRFFGNGTNMSGVIEVPGSLKDDVYHRLKNSWNESYQGLSKSHETPILEAGSQYKRIGIPPNDAQFLETRKFQLSEIARWFGVQPHLLMDLDRSTNNNIEHQGIEFVTFTLAPEIALWEDELKRKMFFNDPDYYCEFNINALLRGDSKARAEFYKGMFAIGAMSPNQIRKYENEPAYEGGDSYFVQAGYMPIEQIKEYYKNRVSTSKIFQNENSKTEKQPPCKADAK